MILYRPVGLQELALIYDSGMKAFPARLPQQPIFYPVLDLDYARQTASGWNAKNGQLAGYVTQFQVEDQYASRFEEHTVGRSQHRELWIPADEIEEFNRHIVGHIKVVEAHFGDAFEGFVPEQFGLKGQNAVEQFTVLANSYLYKRLDFYLEIKRNHKAVFLNYPFWQTYEFKNPGLKGKVIQAIKEAWLTSFPKIPLPAPTPVQEDTPQGEGPPAQALAPRAGKPPGTQPTTPRRAKSNPLVRPVPKNLSPATQPPKQHEVDPVDDATPMEPTEPYRSAESPDEDITLEEAEDSYSLEEIDEEEDAAPVEQIDRPSLVHPVHNDVMPGPEQIDSHFVQGITLGLSEKYSEAIRELSRAVEEDPDDEVAHTSLGVAFHRLAEDDRALACYETALKVDPIYAEAHYFRSNILYERGNIREAIAGYTIAAGLQPELIEAHQKPVPQDRLTDYTGAPAEMPRIAKPAQRILELNRSLDAGPGQADLFKERAAEYYRLRNYAQAIADYSSFLAIRPEDASVLHARGVAYEQLGQSERASEDFQQAAAINPQLSNDYINRGITFGQAGNARQAIDSLTDGIRLAPGNPDAYFNRGVVYFQQGAFASAVDDFSMVIQLSSNDVDAYYWRGISNEAAGNQREAITDYRQFLKLSQDPRAREEIVQKLSQWHESKRDDPNRRSRVPEETPDPVPEEKSDQNLDLYGLVKTLGERALTSTWFGNDVECYGEKAEKLYAYTRRDRPIGGRDFLSLASGIRQTVKGDFQAFDKGAQAPWLFIRAWEGQGFYLETNDLKIKERLKADFQSMEEVEGATPSYEGLFLRI